MGNSICVCVKQNYDSYEDSETFKQVTRSGITIEKVVKIQSVWRGYKTRQINKVTEISTAFSNQAESTLNALQTSSDLLTLKSWNRARENMLSNKTNCSSKPDDENCVPYNSAQSIIKVSFQKSSTYNLPKKLREQGI